jgi:hypothetical protein
VEKVRQKTACACGCGEPSAPPSRYAGKDHFKRLVIVRRRLSRLRRHAEENHVYFDLIEWDVKELLFENGQFVPDRIIERIDKTKGFVPDNIRAKARPLGGRHLG